MQSRMRQVTHLGNFSTRASLAYPQLQMGNTLSHFALEIMLPATQCGQMISYVFASRASSVCTCDPLQLTLFTINY